MRWAVLLTGLLLTAPARASCGLDMCPAPARVPSTHVVARDTVRWTAAHDADDRGWYFEDLVTTELRTAPGFNLNATLPLVWLHEDGVGTSGVGNLVASAEWRVGAGEATQLGGGLQAELPTATEEALGGHHAVVLPYAGAQWSSRAIFGAAVLGYGHSLEAAGHSHGGSIVNPHGRDEILGRAELGWGRQNASGATSIAGLVDSRFRLDDPAEIVEVGALTRWSRKRFDVVASVQAPVTSDRRLDARVSASIGYTIGRTTRLAPGP